MAQAQTSLNLPKYLQEYELTQEFKDLACSMPMETGWVAAHLHQYQGFWHTTRQLLGVLACQNHFKSQDSDILLVSNPKSGTTWLKAIMFAIANRSSCRDPENHPLLTNNPHLLVPFLELDIYLERHVPDLSFLASPRLVSTHLPYVSLPESVKNSACKVVYLCRNPKDTFVSLWHFTNRLRPKHWGNNSLEETFDKFCRGVSLYGPFWDHLLGYWKESLEKPGKVLFLKFDEMKEKPVLHMKKLASFMGFPFSQEEEAKGVVEDILRLCSFENLSNLEVNKTGKLLSGEENRAFFRKGEIGDWKNYLTEDMAKRLNYLTEQKLQTSGLKF